MFLAVAALTTDSPAQRLLFGSLSSSPSPIGDSSYGPPPSSHKGGRPSFRQVLSRVISEPPLTLTYVGQVRPSDVTTHSAVSRQALSLLASDGQEFQRAAGSGPGTSNRDAGASAHLSYPVSQQQVERASDHDRTTSSTSTSGGSLSGFRTALGATQDDAFLAKHFHPSSARAAPSAEPSKLPSPVASPIDASRAATAATMPSSFAPSELRSAFPTEEDAHRHDALLGTNPTSDSLYLPTTIEHRLVGREVRHPQIRHSVRQRPVTAQQLFPTHSQGGRRDYRRTCVNCNDRGSSARPDGVPMISAFTTSTHSPSSVRSGSAIDTPQLEAIGRLNEAMTQLELQEVEGTGQITVFAEGDNNK